MASNEEIQYLRLRKLILANEPDNEYEFAISSSRYDQLRTELGKDAEDNSYPRLLYDWTRRVVTIVTVPTRLHEDTSLAILNSVLNRAKSLMEREGIHLAANQMLGSTICPTILSKTGRSMEPDGAIFFKTLGREEYKFVVEVGISQTHDSLLEKARKWLYDQKCVIVLLVAFYEKDRYTAPLERLSVTSRQWDIQAAQMRLCCESQSHSQFGPIVFQGHTWLDEISEGFIEVVRKDSESHEREALTSMKYILIERGRDQSSGIPRTVGDIRLAELISRECLGSDAVADVMVDFFDSAGFMGIVRNAMIATAVSRFEKTLRLND
ncbi:hypothetical protein V1525DRAFT_348933 [Lipomyces kononenkoae]|uniref:Uncharacterized protein n=1 Tax=Lipomyces kononenkoae TaxID=34357 RepID=A0ACC3SU13_LIPKO